MGFREEPYRIKVMHLSADAANATQNAAFHISRGEISYAEQYRYLGSISLHDVFMQAEVSYRLSRAGHAFVKLNRVWTDQHLLKGIKCSIYKSIVLATLLYGCEIWAVTQGQRHNMDMFQMSCLRRICHISL